MPRGQRPSCTRRSHKVRPSGASFSYLLLAQTRSLTPRAELFPTASFQSSCFLWKLLGGGPRSPPPLAQPRCHARGLRAPRLVSQAAWGSLDVIPALGRGAQGGVRGMAPSEPPDGAPVPAPRPASASSPSPSPCTAWGAVQILPWDGPLKGNGRLLECERITLTFNYASKG